MTERHRCQGRPGQLPGYDLDPAWDGEGAVLAGPFGTRLQFRAMCAPAGRRPHQLAADIMLAAIREAQHDHATQAFVHAARRYQSGLRLIHGGPDSQAGRREVLAAGRRRRGLAARVLLWMLNSTGTGRRAVAGRRRIALSIGQQHLALAVVGPVASDATNGIQVATRRSASIKPHPS
jgi:hypothetical protein